MKGFFRGVLVLALMVSLAFNGAMYYALEERGEAQRQLSGERDGYQARAQEAEQLLEAQRAETAGLEGRITQLQESLEERQREVDELNRSLGQAGESARALEEELSRREAEAKALAQAREEAQAAQAEAAALREENDRLSARTEELEAQVKDSLFGQEDRVQAIAELQRQLSERGQLLLQTQTEYDRLVEQLTAAEETNAGQAVLIEESGQRERQALEQARALEQKIADLEAQLTRAEENYGGAAATLSEQAAALENARQQAAALEAASREDQQLIEAQRAQIESLEAQVGAQASETAALQEALAAREDEAAALQESLAQQESVAQQEEKALRFTGRAIGLSFDLPEGMLAAEYQGAVYLSAQEIQGVIREIPMPGSAEEFGAAQALELVLDELFGAQERPSVAEVEGGYRFEGPDNGAGRSEVCVLERDRSLYYLKLEGDDPKRLEALMEALLARLVKSPA